MANEGFINNINSVPSGTGLCQLSSSISAGATSIPVNATGAFTASTQYHLRIDNELMTVTVQDSTHFTVVNRGVEGTTAASHASGVQVYAPFTAESVNNAITQAVPANNPGLASAASGTEVYFQEFSGTALPAGWSIVYNSGAATTSVARSTLAIAGGVAQVLHADAVAGSTACSWETWVNVPVNGTYNAIAYQMALMVRDSGTSEGGGVGEGYLALLYNSTLQVYTLTTGTVAPQGTAVNMVTPGWTGIRVRRDVSNNWTTSFSIDGNAWTDMVTAVNKSFTIAQSGFRGVGSADVFKRLT